MRSSWTHDPKAPGTGEYLGGPEEDAGALLPLEGTAARVSKIDGFLDVFGGAEVGVVDDALVVMRRVGARLREDFPTSDYLGQRQGLG